MHTYIYSCAQVLTSSLRLHFLVPPCIHLTSGGRPLDVGVVVGMGVTLINVYVMMMVMLFLEAARVEDDDVLKVRAS